MSPALKAECSRGMSWDEHYSEGFCNGKVWRQAYIDPSSWTRAEINWAEQFMQTCVKITFTASVRKRMAWVAKWHSKKELRERSDFSVALPVLLCAPDTRRRTEVDFAEWCLFGQREHWDVSKDNHFILSHLPLPVFLHLPFLLPVFMFFTLSFFFISILPFFILIIFFLSSLHLLSFLFCYSYSYSSSPDSSLLLQSHLSFHPTYSSLVVSLLYSTLFLLNFFYFSSLLFVSCSLNLCVLSLIRFAINP
jgi:hypothetical protein